MSDDEQSIWIRTEPAHGGTGFVVVIETDDDHAFTLSFDQAMGHAKSLLWACAYAEYAAAVYRQMSARFKPETAFSIVTDFQKDWAPFDATDVAPFMFLPGLTRDDRSPMIQLWVEGKAIGLWPLDQAREHALTLVEATCVAQLDADYLRLMRGTIGLPESTARAVVAELAGHRP